MISGSAVRNIYKYNKVYSGAEPVFIEGDVFKTIVPLTTQASTHASTHDLASVYDKSRNTYKSQSRSITLKDN